MYLVVLSLVFLLAPPAPFEDSFRAGLLALQRGDLASARSNLEEASSQSPGDGRVWVALSQTYWKLRLNAEAETAAAKAAALAPEDPIVLESLVIYYTETRSEERRGGKEWR